GGYGVTVATVNADTGLLTRSGNEASPWDFSKMTSPGGPGGPGGPEGPGIPAGPRTSLQGQVFQEDLDDLLGQVGLKDLLSQQGLWHQELPVHLCHLSTWLPSFSFGSRGTCSSPWTRLACCPSITLFAFNALGSLFSLVPLKSLRTHWTLFTFITNCPPFSWETPWTLRTSLTCRASSTWISSHLAHPLDLLLLGCQADLYHLLHQVHLVCHNLIHLVHQGQAYLGHHYLLVYREFQLRGHRYALLDLVDPWPQAPHRGQVNLIFLVLPELQACRLFQHQAHQVSLKVQLVQPDLSHQVVLEHQPLLLLLALADQEYLDVL
ncbi:hypothetical protein DNTS_003612, partial [Danionella cerebrum]